MTPPEALLLDLDKVWKDERKQKIQIRILGSMSLMLQTDYQRGTKDGDILYAAPVDEAVKKQLLELGGMGSRLAKRHSVYIDVVSRAILMLPAQPNYVPLLDLTAKLTHFEVEALSIPDVVISKLKPFRPTDIADINAMIVRDRITHEQFQSLFLALR